MEGVDIGHGHDSRMKCTNMSIQFKKLIWKLDRDVEISREVDVEVTSGNI